MAEHGFFHPEHGYWQTIGDPPQSILDAYPEGTVEIPLKPGPGFEWIDGEWIPPEPDAIRATWRTGAELTRTQFCLRAHQMGLLPGPEAIVAAKGDWPDSFSDALEGLDADTVIQFQIEWASAQTVARLHPAILQVAEAKGLTDEQVDDLFGYEGRY